MRWPFSRPAEPEPTVEKPKRERAPRTGTVPRELYDDLLEKYHALAMSAAQPPAQSVVAAPSAPMSPVDALGPLTQAAIREMSAGMSSASKRAMIDKVLSLAVDVTDDVALADRVRRGESPRMIRIG